MIAWLWLFAKGYVELSTSDRLKFFIATTLESTLLWTSFFLLLLALLKREAKRASRIVTFVHSFLLIAHAVYVTKTSSHHYTNKGTSNTFEEDFLICFTLGYFLYDYAMFHIYMFKQNLFLNIAHLLTICTFTTVMLRGESAAEIIDGIVLFKLTNPLMLIRMMMLDSDSKHSTVGEILDWGIFFHSFVCTVYLAPYFAYAVCWHPRPGLDIKFCVLGLVVMAWCAAKKFNKYMYYEYILSIKVRYFH